MYGQLLYNRGGKNMQHGRTVSSINGAWKTGPLSCTAHKNESGLKS